MRQLLVWYQGGAYKQAVKHILILTADAGFGHRSAANAIAAALAERGGDDISVDIVNPLNDPRTPAFMRDSQVDYDRIVREAPELYRMGYEASEEAIPNALLEGSAALLLFNVLRQLVRDVQPDVIVITYPLYQAPLSLLFTLNPPAIPVITVVTDLSAVHRLWFNRAASALAVPTKAVGRQALVHHIERAKLHVTGIPVNPQISKEMRTKAELRHLLGWQLETRTVLVVSSKRVMHMGGVLRMLNHSQLPLQLVAVAGGDDVQYAALRSTQWHAPAHIYNFVDNLPTMMLAADCLVCKAGGLIVTEALACGLPLLLTEVLPGQEQGNADYVIHQGAGVRAESPTDVLETLFHWFADDAETLRATAQRAKALGQPNAASKVADLALAY